MTTENLFAPSAIKLFGREFKGLSVNQPLTGDSPPLEARARVPIDKIQEKLEHRQGYRQAPGRLERALRKVAANEKDESKIMLALRAFTDSPTKASITNCRGRFCSWSTDPERRLNSETASPCKASVLRPRTGSLRAISWCGKSMTKMSPCASTSKSGPMKEILLRPMFDIEETEGATAGRGAAASRGAAAGRGAAVARGAAITRDPHRNR